MPFEPGQSGNPGGRPKGLAARIRAQTNDGDDLVDLALSVLRDKEAGYRVRLEAATWLADRGFGRPVQETKLTGIEGGTIVVRLDLVTPPERPA